ncbi:MAG: hypothetical protein NUV52_04530 [Candidatus Roizmanbacteria bacterium]|nr:hypothetical protein [Candidatus Roizmanbacteria bacterium]
MKIELCTTSSVEAVPDMQEKIRAIHEAVYITRTRMGIQPQDLTYDAHPEGSCFGLGEFDNLFFVQLVHTHNGHGEWGIITPDPSNAPIIDGLYNWLSLMGLRTP